MQETLLLGVIFEFLFSFGTHETLDHLASFLSSRETISRAGIEPPTTMFGLCIFALSYGSLGSFLTLKLKRNRNEIYKILFH